MPSFVLHTDSMKVDKVNPVCGLPPKFARHTAVTVADKIYLFGGFDGVSKHFHLSVFDTKTTEWTSPRVEGSILSPHPPSCFSLPSSPPSFSKRFIDTSHSIHHRAPTIPPLRSARRCTCSEECTRTPPQAPKSSSS